MVVFSPVVVDTKMIFHYDFIASLKFHVQSSTHSNHYFENESTSPSFSSCSSTQLSMRSELQFFSKFFLQNLWNFLFSSVYILFFKINWQRIINYNFYDGTCLSMMPKKAYFWSKLKKRSIYKVYFRKVTPTDFS